MYWYQKPTRNKMVNQHTPCQRLTYYQQPVCTHLLSDAKHTIVGEPPTLMYAIRHNICSIENIMFDITHKGSPQVRTTQAPNAC